MTVLHRTVRGSNVNDFHAAWLIKQDVPSNLIEPLHLALCNVRGAHRVEVTDDYGRADETWRRVHFYGTDAAVRMARLIMAATGHAADPNADHDHDDCIASARSLGVPESWAHRPEAYLSM